MSTKVTINFQVNKITVMSISGNVYPCLSNGKKACGFTPESFSSASPCNDKEKEELLKVVTKIVSDNGYKYYHTNDKDNFLSKCPYKDKVITANVIQENDKVFFEIEGKKYDVAV